jgi:alpha-glucosidase
VALTAERHMVFDWALLLAPWSAEAYGAAIRLRESMFGNDRWLANVLSNHDQSRQASRLAESAGIADTDAVAKAAALVLLTIRGTPFLYYGEELGLRDVPIPKDEIIDPPARRALVDPEFEWWNRDQCRSPMPWDGEPGHGFTTGTPWLRFGEDAGLRNVAAQAVDPDSVLGVYRRVMAARRASEALRAGTLELVDTGTPDVLAWRREADDERLLVIVNFAADERTTAVAGRQRHRALVGTHREPVAPLDDGRLVLRPLEGVVLAAE